MSTTQRFTKIGGGVLACFAVMTLVVAGAAPVNAQQEGEHDLSTTMGRGRACTQWFYDQEFERIEALGLTDAMQQAMDQMGGLAGFWETVNAQLGVESEMVDETESQQQGLDVYLRTAKFEKYDGDIGVQWVFDGEGAIAGFAIQPKQ